MPYDKTKARKNRSDKYQHLIQEVMVGCDFLSSFENSQSMENHLNPYVYDEELFNAKEQLRLEFWKLADTISTDRQKTILHYIADGYTQQEIARILKVNQSSVTKCINGNMDYKNGKRTYGGAIHKLKKAIAIHPVIQQLLEKIVDLQQDRY